MTNEEMVELLTVLKNKLHTIEKVLEEGVEKLNQRMIVLEEGHEWNQDRFDVLEEHMVKIRDDINKIIRGY